MSKFHFNDESKLEQHAASAASPSSPSRRGSRGDSPRLTPNRIFTSQIGCIIKNKEKERNLINRAKPVPPEVKIKEETDDSDPTDPTHTNMHLLQERQEPYGAECEDDSFGGLKEEIRVHLTTEVHLIPLPGEESLIEPSDDSALQDEEDVSNTSQDQIEQLSPQFVFQGSHKKNAMEELEANALPRRKSSKSKKRKKSKEESPQRTKSPTKEPGKRSGRSRKAKQPVQNEESESPDRNPSPTKRQPKHRSFVQMNDEIKVKIKNEIQGEENDNQLNRSTSLIQNRDFVDSFSTPRNRHEERKRSCSRRRHSSPVHQYSSSSYSTPVKTEDSISLDHLRNLNPLSKMSSSESYVDVAVSSASDDEIIDHEVFTVHDSQHVMESPTVSAMSSRSGSGCSKSSNALDFIPFCPPRPASLPARQEMFYTPTPPSTGSPYATGSPYTAGSPFAAGSPYAEGSPYAAYWHHPYDPNYQQYSGTPPPAMHQGVFQWQGPSDSDAIASLIKYPPPPHPRRPLFSSLTPPPPLPPGTAEYPIKRYSLPSLEAYQPQLMNRYSLLSSESSTEQLPHAPMSVVDKRFSCLQSLHNPPKPNIFGYQLIGDSMLVRFAQQILKENPLFAESLRFLGYCVSGQRIGDLLKRLKSGFYHIGNKVVLMIGTNDLCKNSQAEQMIHELRRVLEHLCTKAEKIVVLTLPPVPRYEHYTHHWTRLNKYNDFIRTLNNRERGISVFDISPLYLLSKEELEEEELLAEFNSDAPFCRGCLTCMEEVEEFSDSSLSDEDDIMETDLLTSVLISTSPSLVSHLDICNLFCNKRISKCRMDCFELTFSESSNRKDLIHLNRKGLELVKEALYKLE